MIECEDYGESGKERDGRTTQDCFRDGGLLVVFLQAVDGIVSSWWEVREIKEEG
jgi:hypothetical protein